MCDCELCERLKRLGVICEKLDSDDAAWLRDFGARSKTTELELQYYKSVFAGTWPGAAELLERALHKAMETRG